MNFVERDDMIYDAGASVAVTYDGELVVDLWGGTIDTDADRNVPWERDTIISVWSTTKTVSALACLVAIVAANSTSTHPWPLLARVQGGRQGRDRGPPRDEPHSRLGGMVGTAARRGAVRLGGRRRSLPPRSPGGSRGRRRATADTGLPRRRAGAADHGADVRPVRRRTGHRTARGRFPHRHVGRARRPHRPRRFPGPRSASRRRRRRRSPGGRSRICPISRPAPPTPRRGGARNPAAGGHGNASR